MCRLHSLSQATGEMTRCDWRGKAGPRGRHQSRGGARANSEGGEGQVSAYLDGLAYTATGCTHFICSSQDPSIQTLSPETLWLSAFLAVLGIKRSLRLPCRLPVRLSGR